MSTFIFLWLQNQVFYKSLQQNALKPIGFTKLKNQKWADIGCSTGLITRLAHQLNYNVIGYDINTFSLLIAKTLSLRKNIIYKKEDFHTLNQTFDVISATSLLSVVQDKEISLDKLISLLNNTSSTLIIIEPTEKLTVKNVWNLIIDIKSFWFYKGLLLWAKAREGKSISNTLFSTLQNVTIRDTYHLNSMVRVTYIQIQR